MRKIRLLLTVGLAALLTTLPTSAFAEITADDIVDLVLEKQSMDKSFDMSLLEYDDNGNLLVYNNDGVYVPEIPIVPENTFRRYQYKKPSIEALENYSGGGFVENFKDFPMEEESYPYIFVEKLETGRLRAIVMHTEHLEPYIGIDVTDDYYSLAEEAAKLLNEEGIQEIFEAQLALVTGGYNHRNDEGVLVWKWSDGDIYFDTDKGEYVVTRYRIIDKFSDKYEYVIYTMKEFIEFNIWTLSETSKTSERVTSTTVIEDEDGNEIEIENDLGWTILDETQDPSKKTDKTEESIKEDVEEEPKDVIKDEPEEEIEEEPKVEEVPDDIEEEQPKEEEPEKELEEEEPVEEPVDEPKVDEKPEKTEIDVLLFGRHLTFPDQKPIIENDRVLVPFRVIFEALEADVLWDGDTRTVTAIKGDITISLTIGENKIVKNGEAIEIDVPAQIQNSRTLVPIRVVSESFKNTVSWDGANRIVEIK